MNPVFYTGMSSRGFYRLSLSTLIAVYVLILVGGIVRSTGSGMGCPDWPRCFGAWVPPTSVGELPENYKEIYSEHRHQKNVKFAKYLSALGFSETAENILADESILHEADFNAVKTWIEYINRLIGAVIGLFIASLFLYSIRFRKSRPSWTAMAFLTLFMVGFQGWIGSFVVSTNLTPWTITLHMFLALLIVAQLIWLVHQTNPNPAAAGTVVTSKSWVIIGLIALLLQILLGTQVRESLDQAAVRLAERAAWIDELGLDFLIHRSFSWFILAVHGMIIYKMFRNGGLNAFGLVVILLILGTILSGTGMAYYAVPPFLQPVHLLLASLTFGMLFLWVLKLNTTRNSVVN